MRLTAFTDFGLRALMRLAGEPERSFTTDEIATEFAISRHHLTKIANELVRGGFLTAVRGRNGGLKLARPATSINVADVVRFCESSAPLVECFDPKTNKCVITPHCTLKTILFSAESAFYAALAAHTLADLMVHGAELRNILN